MLHGLRRRRRVAADWCAAALAGWLLAVPAHAQCPIKFRDVTEQTGIDFVHTHGGSGRKYIVETVTAGLATFDYDNDGKIDIYFLNGRPLAGTEASVPPKNRLYRNLGSFRFKDVTDEAGVGGGAGYG
ncbi:MAG: VCBS repeat-containing protein, partial [Thermoguttaceae bacterium]